MKIVEKIRGRRSRLNRRRAFTLIEMMAALALAMILLYMLFQIFTTVGRAMTISNARSEIHANARAILRIMHQEISGAFLDTSRDADSDTAADYFIEGYGERVDQSTVVKKASFSNASTQVTGNNTYWQGLVQRADSILGPDGEWYMISAVVSNTELTLARPYEGTTASTADYSIASPLLQFLTTSALGRSGALSEVGYWLDTTDVQNRMLRRRLASDPTNYDSDPDTTYTSFDASNRVLDMNNDGDFDDEVDGVNELPTTAAAEEATILGENVLAFNVEHYDAATDTFASGDYTSPEKRLTTAVRITLRVRDSRGRLSEGEEFVEIIAIKGRE